MSFNVLTESLTNGYRVELLLVISIISVLLAINVIITKNPVLSVLFLIGLFFSISLYLMMIGLYFIGLSYLLVYVGAVSILFLFILMLINVRVSELITEGKNSIPLAIIAIVSFNMAVTDMLPNGLYLLDILSNYIIFINKFILTRLPYTSLDTGYYESISYASDNKLASVSSISWDNNLANISHISSIGNILYTNLFMFLIITSLILLLAMVGCIVITIGGNSQHSNPDNK